MTRSPILHLVPAAYFHSLTAIAPFVPRDFAQDGFIHCTGEPQSLLCTANQFYKDVPGEMLVLVIDPTRVEAEVKFEAPIPVRDCGETPGLENNLFHHVSGPLNQGAIARFRSARRAADGTLLAV